MGCHCADRPVDHRLGPPGELPVNPGGAMIVEVKPT
jgi:hypothetical protein